jgi:hypothetical protein
MSIGDYRVSTYSVVFRAIAELVGLIGFLVGYFLHVKWLTIGGGLLIVFDDLMQMLVGALKPLFPLILAVVLALILSPWYVGIFWASAAFKILDIPTLIVSIFNPSKVVTEHASSAKKEL